MSVDVAGSSARVRARVVAGEGEERKADLLIDARERAQERDTAKG